MTTDGRLSTELWVMGHVRQCIAQGIVATIAHKGDAWGGAVILKLNLLGPGFRILSQTRDLEGRVAWLQANGGTPMPESEADAYIERQVKRDPDLWVVEIEDRRGTNPFEGKLL
jgi:hypothetical protein